MRQQGSPDYFLLSVFSFLIVFGLVMLFSASMVLSQRNFGYTYHYFLHQLIYGIAVGIIFAYLAYKIDYHFLKKIALPLFLISLVFLFLVFVPHLGYSSGGAKRWINIAGFSFQPSELAKLSFIIYLSAWLEKRKKASSFSLLSFLIMIGTLGIFIALQPDIGTLGVIFLIALSMYFVAGAPIKHIFLTFFLILIIFLVLINIAPYRMSRLLVYLEPDIDPQGQGYQINQALLAIGSGGIAGVGFGQSRQKYFYLPEPVGDSIFAIIAEELGFIGSLILVFCYLALGIQGFVLASRTSDIFGRLLIVGIISWIVGQAFVNIAAISGLIPLTGLPLPFVSYGGSSLFLLLIAVGILLNISKSRKIV